jgi:molybdopterin molybdotransferase
MITHEEALQIILNKATVVETEEVLLTDCLSRVLACDVFSPINMPPFNKSAVDGYACRKEDIQKPLIVLETIAAGNLPKLQIQAGTCSKIMTGAMVPKGADTVIMVEDIREIDSNTIEFTAEKTSSNICLKGEDMKVNDLVLQKGTLLKAWHVGILATVGLSTVNVFRKIALGIITTGDELQEPGEPLEEGKIRNSNAWQLMASCEAMMAHPKYYGIVKDELNETTSTIQKAIAENDVVLITGGVSMGDFDFVPRALIQAGFEILFDSVAMQPGRPLTYATDGKKHCFGLPGNPVSSFIQFELSVKPLIYELMGHKYEPFFVPLKAEKTIHRKKAQRTSYYPVTLTSKNTIIPIEYHGSAHINAFTNAFGIIAMKQGVLQIEEGDIVHVRQL